MSARARWTFRLHGLLAVARAAIAISALVVALRATVLSMPSVGRLAAACRSWVLPQVTPTVLLVLGLALLSLTVIGRAVRSGLRAVRAGRMYLAGLSRAGELGGPTPAQVIRDTRPMAFCAGLCRPGIYISTGAIDTLDEDELDAVLAHEAHHAARRDPLRLLVAQALADGLFFLPVMRHLRRRYASLAELAADEAAVAAIGRPGPLASAMLAFGDLDGALVVGVSAERVDHLMGARPRWELPASLLAGAALTVAGLAGLIGLAAHATQLAQVSIPMLMMQSCGPLMIGAALALALGVRRYRTQ